MSIDRSMSIHPNLEPLEGLPAELAELDQELSHISPEERPSFGPELRNELAREWARPTAPRSNPWIRHALAACLAGVAVVGISVPPARASIVQGVQRIFDSFRGEETGQVAGIEVEISDRAPPMDEELAAAPVDPPREPVLGTPSGPGVELPPFQPGMSTFPSLLDDSEGRRVALEYYPEDLQQAGIGGVVRLHLWVKEDGEVEFPQIPERGSSGVQALDRAALRAAEALHFRPAMRNGVPVATWVEFDMVFEPPVEVRRAVTAPAALETPGIPEVTGWEPPETWAEAAVVPAPIRMEARSLLRVSMGGDEEALERRFGPLEGVLSGDPPEGVNPVVWRTEVSRALEEARVRDPENPAPYLALARLRRKQGQRNDAQLLFQRGLDRATRGRRPASPRLVAELAYESGRIARERWLGWRNLGNVPVEALAKARCAAAVGPGEMASPETLLAWNFTCPEALQEVLDRDFVRRPEGGPERATMLAAFVQAVEAYPAHVGANVELLLDLAEQEEWHRLLEGASRFGWASQGHPSALLLEGLALHRLGRSEEAASRFQEALAGLGPEEASAFRRLDRLIPELASEDGADWRRLDPILSTEVNERAVEHMARAAYAFLRFGSLEADAARVWVRYGHPRAIRAFGAGPGLRLEFWDYGEGPDLAFHRPTSSQNGALTTEAETYLEELVSFFPHWYGNRARPLYALPAQLARFQGIRRGSSEVRVRFRIPAEFRAGNPDALDVNLFLVDGTGVPVESLDWTVDPGQPEVDLLAPLGPGIRGLVVELYDPAAGLAAAARADLSTAPDATSDLLLLEAASPSREEIRHMAEGLDALASVENVPDLLGVYAEFYDLPPGTVYDLRFELVDEEAGTRMPLEFRPAGQTLFGGSWTRRTPDAGVAGEFATLDLRSVGKGTYTLRMIARTDTGGERVVEHVGVTRLGGGAGSFPSPGRPPGIF